MIRRVIVLLGLAALAPGIHADDSPLTLLRESAELVVSGKNTEATAKYTQAIADSGENTPERRRIFLLQRGLELWARGRADLAAQEIPTLRRITLDAPEAAALEAFLLLEQGRPTDALKALPAEDEATPFVGPVRALAMMRDASSDHSPAIESLMSEITHADESNYLRSRALGEWGERSGDARTALAGWEVAAHALPAHAATQEKFRALAVAYATNPPRNVFEKKLENIIAGAAPGPGLDAALSRLLLERDRALLAEQLAREPSNTTALALLAENRLFAGELYEADRLLARLRELAPNQQQVGDTNLITLGTHVAAARDALRKDLPPLLDELRRAPSSPTVWAKLAEFWFALDMPGRAYACLLPESDDAATAGLTLRFWVRLAERFPGDKSTELLASHADEEAKSQLENEPRNADAWATRLAALRLLHRAPLEFLREHRDLLVSAQAVGVQEGLAPFIALQNALQAATIEEFDVAFATLKSSSASETTLEEIARQRTRLGEAAPRYLAAMAARQAALEKKDWLALAAADRDAAQVTPSGAAFADLTAEREMALGYDALSRGLFGSAVIDFDAAAGAAFSLDRIQEAKDRAKEVRAAGVAAISQFYIAKKWDEFIRAVDDWGKLKAVPPDLAIRRISALIESNRLPEAVTSATATLARTDLTEAQRKAISAARESVVSTQRKRQLRKAWQLWVTGRYDSSLAVLRAFADTPFANTSTRLIMVDRLNSLHRTEEAIAVAVAADHAAENQEARVQCLRVIFALHGPPPADLRQFSNVEMSYVVGHAMLAQVSAVVKSTRAPADPYLESWLNPVLSRRLAHIRELAGSLQSRSGNYSGAAESYTTQYRSLQSDLGASWTPSGNNESPFEKGSWMNPNDTGPSYLARQEYDAGVRSLVASAQSAAAHLSHVIEHDRAVIEQLQIESREIFAP